VRIFLALATAIAAVSAVAATAPVAHGASGVEYGLTDDAWLTDGPGEADTRVATLQSLGVKAVRYTLAWNELAPTEPVAPSDPEDPAYDWSSVTDVLDALHAHRIDVVLQLYGSPAWANGGKPPNYVPNTAAAFGAFATAAAREFPWVKKWQIWNEPNQARWLRPTSAGLYVTRLLNPAYTAIHRAIGGAKVAGGGTAPRGSTRGVSPVSWLEAMHRTGAHLDAYAHNPYPLDPKRETPLTGGCTHCSTITMATLGKLVTLVAKDFPRARIWLTEYGYQSNPPDRILGVSTALQARYASEGAYVAYEAPRVDLLIHFLYRDEPNPARFQSGLMTLGNKPKPALAAYALPLAETHRTGRTTSLWGQLRAPAAGSTGLLERRVGSTWSRIATVEGGARGFFRWHGTLARGSVVRLRAGTLVGAPLTVT
jgi:hypothetical protein